jgi:uncharacterized protein YgiM (DUF1202 family)
MLLRLTSAAVLLAASASLAFAKPVTLPAETNLREAPGTKSNVVTLIPKGTEVEVGECDAGWCKVTANGKDGYVIERNLSSTPKVAPAGPRQPQQADMQKLRRGYEQYFGADIPADQRQRNYGNRQQYAERDDEVDYSGSNEGYVPVAPPRAYYYGPPPAYYYPGPYYYGYGYRPYGYWRRW